MNARISAAVELLKKEAATINNPDPCIRLYAAKMRLDAEIIKILDEMKKGKKKKGSSPDKIGKGVEGSSEKPI
ncbi:MAG TPA: hypothetical protein VMW42_08550 [Desulfatiglandales bacterium]|nr:hypothetical protein [Desulfatiglandales bacterium]